MRLVESRARDVVPWLEKQAKSEHETLSFCYMANPVFHAIGTWALGKAVQSTAGRDHGVFCLDVKDLHAFLSLIEERKRPRITVELADALLSIVTAGLADVGVYEHMQDDARVLDTPDDSTLLRVEWQKAGARAKKRRADVFTLEDVVNTMQEHVDSIY